jgi:hypothetical protein
MSCCLELSMRCLPLESDLRDPALCVWFCVALGRTK